MVDVDTLREAVRRGAPPPDLLMGAGSVYRGEPTIKHTRRDDRGETCTFVLRQAPPPGARSQRLRTHQTLDLCKPQEMPSARTSRQTRRAP